MIIIVEDIGTIVANNLKGIRKDRKLSLDKVAELTDVSKSMLGQIERGESNPTIHTIWKIANGLKVSLTSLIVAKKLEILLVRKEDISPIIEDRGKFRLYPMFPFDDERRFEILNIEIDPGSLSTSEPHEENTIEHLTVHEGELTLRINEEEYKIKAGDGIRYFADQKHSYGNLTEEMIKLSMVIYYPN